MTLWETLGLLGVLALWSACGLLPNIVALIAVRGRARLRWMPLAAVAGVAGGLLVAALAKDGLGFAISLAAATAAGAVVPMLSVRRARILQHI